MINLKELITKYPECLESSEKLRSYLKDLYPNEKAKINIIVAIFSCDIHDGIKKAKTLDSITISNFAKRLENEYGYSINISKECIELWVNAYKHYKNETSKSIENSETNSNVNKTKTSVKIRLGDYIQMGTYYGKPIFWRCVSFEKISGYDDNGNPIIDSTDTVTEYQEGYLPLIFSDRIICLKAFDAGGYGNVLTCSHGRGWNEKNIQGYWRQQEGSNCWSDSNIRDWLNSNATDKNVVWSCGNPPDAAHLRNGYNAYNGEAGFLTNFSENEINLIKNVAQKSLLDRYECSSSPFNEQAPNYHKHQLNIENAVQNYNTAFSDYVTDKIFLLDVKQISTVYENSNILGNNYYIGIPTNEAVSNSEYREPGLDAILKWWSWLRSPTNYVFYSCLVRTVNAAVGEIGGCEAYEGTYGVRPAFFLDVSCCSLNAGDGGKENPYTLAYIKNEISPKKSEEKSSEIN